MKNKQKPGRPKRTYVPSVQQLASSPGPTIRALGKTWRDVDVRLMLSPALKRTPAVRRFIDELVAEAQRVIVRRAPRSGSRRR